MDKVYNYQMTTGFFAKKNMSLGSKEVYALEVENSLTHVFITFLSKDLIVLDSTRLNQDQSSLNSAESLVKFWCGEVDNPHDLRRHFKEVLPVLYYK